MNSYVRCLVVFGTSVALAASSAAHGGTYRGPGDTVPPGGRGGGGGGGYGSPTGAPGSGSPSGPTQPGSVTPGGAGVPGGKSGSSVTQAPGSGPDLTLWQYWWGFNKEPYLDLKSRIRGAGVQTGSDEFYLGVGTQQRTKDRRRPHEDHVRGVVVPALLTALREERDDDVLTASLIALAKIGDRSGEGGRSPFELAIEPFLAHPNQEVAETAAVSLGILGNETSIPTLVALMLDRPSFDGSVDPHRLVRSTSVAMRTRAFAAYGLGLIGAVASSNEVRQQIAEHLMDMLEAPELSTRDVKVGAMIALGLTPVDAASGDAPPAAADDDDSNRPWVLSRQRQVRWLLDYFDPARLRANAQSRHWFTTAHAPTAIARLLRDVSDPHLEQSAADALIAAVDMHSKVHDEVQQSCILALGAIGDCDSGAGTEAAVDVRIREELARLAKSGDVQARRFALIALARVGGRRGSGEEPWGALEQVRRELMAHLSKGRSLERPWAALALGVLGHALREGSQVPAEYVDRALLAACEEEGSPEHVGAYCLALGLRRYADAAPALLAVLQERFGGSDDARGEAAVALGLLGDGSAIAAIQQVVQGAGHRAELLRQSAIGLGLLGDRQIVSDLVDMLRGATSLTAQGAVSSALGVIGDRDSIDPLLALLVDRTVSGRARAFAAVALGIVCDKEDLPWNSRFAVDGNYRANTPTLTSPDKTGILDIL